ncbi:MAG: DUF1579 domain-containing protein [Planctomycetes bacterium]|nr:DUF1579 domain-containing protein [Planctomycetota bacterium]
MSCKFCCVGCAVLGAAVFLSAGMFAQETKGPPKMSAEDQAMMEAYKSYGTPGEPHARLVKKAGNWNIAVKMWHSPDMEVPEESTATSRIKAIMGGRYILEKVKGEAMGMPFEGLGISGYDNLTKKFIGVWVDTMSTGIIHSEGTPAQYGDIINFEGTHPDPLRGKYVKSRSVERTISDDKFIFTSYKTSDDGREFKGMELTYTRAE